ncbi:MAG: hypothetical protein AABX48_02110 [Nanoarchaeota archaeon]
MKQIKTKEDYEKKKKRNQIIVGVVLILLMILSSAGYAFQSYDGSTQKTINYNRYNFVGQNGAWNVLVGNNQFNFVYNPKQTEVIDGNFDKIESYSNQTIYIYSQSANAESEIRDNLGKIAYQIDNACPIGIDCPEGYVKKGCENRFIIITENEKNVRQESGCVYIQGGKSELIRLTDAFLFKVLRINS